MKILINHFRPGREKSLAIYRTNPKKSCMPVSGKGFSETMPFVQDIPSANYTRQIDPGRKTNKYP